MRVCLIGHDVAPSQAFLMFEPILKGHGDTVCTLVANGKPPEFSRDDIQKAVRGSDIVLIGMSALAKNAELEIFAAETARKNSVTYGFYGDVAKCWGRAGAKNYFGPVAADAEFYMGVHQKDANDAVKVFHNHALFYGTGNPVREEDAFPKMTREKARGILEISENEKLILVPGSKFAGANFSLLAILMEALEEVETTGTIHNIQVIFCLHPGDKTPYAVDPRDNKELKLYQEFLTQSSVPSRMITKNLISSADAVSGADLVIECGSSIGFVAVFQRVPVITVPIVSAINRWEEINHSRTTELMDDRVSYVLDNVDPFFLSGVVANLLDHESEEYKNLLEIQKEKYPLPQKRGEALQKMINVIHEIGSVNHGLRVINT